MSNWLEATDIDVNIPETFDLLKNLQANILKHHGRRHAWHVFLQFVPGRQSQVKQWTAALAAAGKYGITSAYTQLKDAEKKHYSADKGKSAYDGGLITSFMLSAEGYKYFGLKPADIAGEGNTFTRMIDGNQKFLQDPPLKEWEPAFQVEIHAMLLLADNSRRTLRWRLKQLRSKMHGSIRIITNEKGRILRNDDNKAIEHFGYEDGISQPVFLANGHKPTPVNWHDRMPLSVVLTPDNGTAEKNCYGSFVVFRKLEQNVKKFFEKREELSGLLFQNNDARLAGALAVGRFEDGTPLTLPEEELKKLQDKNDFNYSMEDPDTPRCPYHAHIRITNPRANGSKMRIVRRGITYDEIGRKKDLSDRPEHGVGLYFISYQARLSMFETIQHWTAGGKVNLKSVGIDPIAGQGTQKMFKQEWHVTNGQEKKTETGDHFMHVVTMLGGEYFYAPSIPFLQGLAML